ncbi:MAG TPA: hypothetical protein EYN03_00055 [Planctomycetes bacterium]|nr:hypothetical protein [Planctomycetaceae bacterium]HIN94010.1 hypothetical protein [Planctomycetota bacterium]
MKLPVKLSSFMVLVLTGMSLSNLGLTEAADEPCFHPSGSSNPVAVEVADLKDQLEKGLKARLPADFSFISKVVMLVENDKLPLKTVKAVFQWARDRGAKNNYPFPYFQRALKIRAKKLGIVI